MMKAQKNPTQAEGQAQGPAQPVAPAQTDQAREQLQSSARSDGKSNVPPQAPTTEKPPMTFERPGSQTSPHGTPRMYGNNNFDASKINIPEKRKRRQGSMTEEAKITPNLQQARPVETGTIKPPAPELLPAPLPFKCPIPGCEYELFGFATPEEADKHAEDAHNYDGDGLEWCLSMLRGALDLDKSGQPKPKVAQVHRPDPPNHTAPLNETPAQAFKREQAERRARTQHGANSIAPTKPKTDRLPTLAESMDAYIPAKSDSTNGWKNANVQPEQLYSLFSNLRDFPAANHGLESFTGMKARPVEWPNGPPEGMVSMKDLADEWDAAHPEDEEKETVKVRIEDYNPYPEFGGTDYTGKNVELIHSNEPFVPDVDGKVFKDLLAPGNIERICRTQEEEERKREELENVGFVSESAIEAFLRGDLGEENQREEDEGETPPKRMKMSPRT